MKISTEWRDCLVYKRTIKPNHSTATKPADKLTPEGGNPFIQKVKPITVVSSVEKSQTPTFHQKVSKIKEGNKL